MSNFESKHPRAKDGKFTEKLRKESGLELVCNTDDREETEEYAPPKSVVEIDIAGEIEELKDNEGNVFARKYVAEEQGYGPVRCYETWHDGRLLSREYSEREDPNKPVRSLKMPAVETWHAGGQFRSVEYRPTKQQIEGYFAGGGLEGNAPLVTSKKCFENGSLESTNYWESNSNGEMRVTHESFYESGARKIVARGNIDRQYDSAGDEPAIVHCFENGQTQTQEWDRNGEVHRETGPAIIEYTEDGRVKAEKYYLNGEEVTDTRSLFGSAS